MQPLFQDLRLEGLICWIDTGLGSSTLFLQDNDLFLDVVGNIEGMESEDVNDDGEIEDDFVEEVGSRLVLEEGPGPTGGSAELEVGCGFVKKRWREIE